MSYTDRQLQGKYKGIKFGTRKETLLSVGQSRVKHRYVKSKTQYQEAMGEEPFSCSVDLFFSGTDFREDYKKFEKAIKSPSSGRLFLPTYGLYNSIVAEPASFDSDQKSLGEITATVIFTETIEKPAPTDTNISEQDVADTAEIARQSLKSIFEDNYIIPASANNLLTAKGDILSMGNNIKTITNKAREVETFLKKIDSVLANTSAYGNVLLSNVDPIGFLQSLAISYTGTAGVAVFKKMSLTGSDLSNSMSDLISGIIPIPSVFNAKSTRKADVKTDISLWEDNTQERVDRNLGRIAIADTFRVTALLGLMESLTTKDYTTTDGIDNDLKEFNSLYETLVENNENSNIISLMKKDLDNLRNLTDSVMDKKKQQSFIVVEIEVIRPISSWLLAYNLYGEYLQTEAQHDYMSNLIAGLNRSQVRYRLEETVRVVEIGN